MLIFQIDFLTMASSHIINSINFVVEIANIIKNAAPKVGKIVWLIAGK